MLQCKIDMLQEERNRKNKKEEKGTYIINKKVAVTKAVALTHV